MLAILVATDKSILFVFRSIADGFTQLTNSFVDDILLPPLSVLLPLNRNLDEKFAVLKPGPNYDSLGGYTTLSQAIEDGAVVMAYGYGFPVQPYRDFAGHTHVHLS